MKKRHYTHRDDEGMPWRFEGARPISRLADEVMDAVVENPVLEYVRKLNTLLASFSPRLTKRYHNTAQFLLAHAEDFTGWPVTVTRCGVPQECFRNATLLACRDTALLYCEGYAAAPKCPFPVEHAWCINPASRTIIETTWTSPGEHYFGVPIAGPWLRQWLRRSDYYGVIHTVRAPSQLLAAPAFTWKVKLNSKPQ